MTLRVGEDGLWARAAALATASIVLLVAFETVLWHPGFARGDEVDVIAAMQRSLEFGPFRWVVSNGSIHKTLLRASMGFWSGNAWATSVPAMLALALEGLLLFLVGRRIAGPRAGFYAVVAGLGTAFALTRGRSALSLSLFQVEWLFLLWWRGREQKAWESVLWGLALGLCCFDYEGWLPSAFLALAVPLEGPLPWRRRALELFGFLAAFALLLTPLEAMHYVQRRRSSSLLMPTTPSGGWSGFKDLVLGGPYMPYLAPATTGVLPWWQCLLLPVGALAWGRRAWAPLLVVLVGALVVLAGGAPYGLPAHRFIIAVGALALLSGLALDRLHVRWGGAFVGAGLALMVGLQLADWSRSADLCNAGYRVLSRDMGRAAAEAWQQSRRLGAPLVSETHPLKGPIFRFLVGHRLPLPDAQAGTVVAYIPWEYLPGLKGAKAEVAGFRESKDHGPELVAVLQGASATRLLAVEREIRPVFERTKQCCEAGEGVRPWLDRNPKADPWSRTMALDYEALVMLSTGKSLRQSWVQALQSETLVSARPLITTIKAIQGFDPERALACAKQARGIDPSNLEVFRLQRGLLLRAGRDAEASELDREAQTLYEQGRLLTE